MSIFDLHSSVVQDYRRYVQSFLSIADDRLRGFVENQIVDQAVFWPDALLQLNPAYELVEDVAQVASTGNLTGTVSDIFRDREGKPIRLYRHQLQALQIAAKKQSYVVTSGTGSGKSLTYFLPIFDAILRGNHEDKRVWAIVIYPMNALVNSQFEALEALRLSYQDRTGRDMPVRFAKYTGQESDSEKQRIQSERPHILLTNYMMLEMMLLRPKESAFVDRNHSNIQFLVLDELHMYRGRQGADVSMLIRRLKERCGNDQVLHVGTSATMVANRSATGVERRQAVADFATKMFGTDITATNVIEESLVPVATFIGDPSKEQLRDSFASPVPTSASELIASPLTKWLETAVGIETDSEGVFRRKVPRSLTDVSSELSNATDEETKTCMAKLQAFFLAGSQTSQASGGAVFPFKLHQFISQGRAVYATVEAAEKRELTLDGQYYAKSTEDSQQRLLFPLTFCRVCGQEYYKILFDETKEQIIPWDNSPEDPGGNAERGYLLLPSTDFSWTTDDLPPDWIDPKGNVKRDYRNVIPREVFVQPDGCVSRYQGENSVRAYFQGSPFLICQSCGEYYSQREGDFRKLTGLSNEGRSSATTTLGVCALHHAEKAQITGASRKLLSFTDNRQDASLQAGHFNDFVLVSVLRAAIYRALDAHGELRHFDMAEKTMACLDLPLREYAANRELDPASPQADKVRKEFRDLIQFRIYEDLRRGWRVLHPNLEQCGLLKIVFEGLEGACNRDDVWSNVCEIAALNPTERFELLKPFLDFARKKLAIHAESLRENYLQQLRIRVNQVVGERWAFDESEERLRPAERLIFPNQKVNVPGTSLGSRSLVGRYFKRRLPGMADYTDFIEKLVATLGKQGLLRLEAEKGVRYAQLESASLVWVKGDGTPPAPDPIYSRRVKSDSYVKVEQKANQFFATLYGDRARSLGDVEGLEHTAQITYENREEREKRFRSGDLKLLFCSPTMELGIDIRDLQLVHMRNVPPTPASYAQRSGRAGRKGDPALILTYCSASSGHDQYYFRLRQEMVAGSVRPPKIDLSNEDLVRCHLQALWFGKVNLRIERSIDELLDLSVDGYPLKEQVKSIIALSEHRLQECIAEGRHVLDLCGADIKDAPWFTSDWIGSVVLNAAQRFDSAFERWRQLYRAAITQLLDAQRVQATTLDEKALKDAQQRINEALRQRGLLTNTGTTRQESDFYPYRYLASEGFLPGYNFPRLPIRIYVPRRDGEFLSRARFLALTEFGPENFIYHEGSKFQVKRFFAPPGGLAALQTRAKSCEVCGYFNRESDDLCSHCCSSLDGSNSLFLNLLNMPNARAVRRERITCDEEERIRRGYKTTTHFQFAKDSEGRERTVEAVVGKDPASPFLRAIFAPSATLYRINHGWKGRTDEGYVVNLSNGEINPERDPNNENQQLVRLFVNDTNNLLILYPPEQIQQNEKAMATLQFALQRGIEQVFQVEESELVSERIGKTDRRGIVFWEASEGGVGVLRRLVEEENLAAKVACAALERLHFDPATGEDKSEKCSRACYECILSYSNQSDHRNLDRHLVLAALQDLAASSTTRSHGRRDYESQYTFLKNLTDSRSKLEQHFVDHLYQTRRDLPDEAQKALAEVNTIPDFYYSGTHTCIYCDGSVHDEPAQKQKDDGIRRQLRELGYRVIVIRYGQELEEQVAKYSEVFGLGKK